MSNLTQKLRDLANYEFGVNDIDSLLQNHNSLALANFFNKIANFSNQGVLLTHGAGHAYNGNLKEVAKQLALIGAVEVIKYAIHRGISYENSKQIPYQINNEVN